MVEEVGELELGDGLPEEKPQEPYYGMNMLKMMIIPLKDAWLPLYRV